MRLYWGISFIGKKYKQIQWILWKIYIQLGLWFIKSKKLSFLNRAGRAGIIIFLSVIIRSRINEENSYCLGKLKFKKTYLESFRLYQNIWEFSILSIFEKGIYCNCDSECLVVSLVSVCVWERTHMRVCANLLCGDQRVIQSVLSCHFVESGDETQACRKVCLPA